ncbi:MAG: RNase P subunit p30 family protein, partial [Candidatus Odinarchaeia archaeon]
GEEEFDNILNLISKLGYSGVGLNNIKRLNFLNKVKFELYYRKTIFAETIKEVKTELKKINSKSIIAVNTKSRAVASWCARDTRIKILSMDLDNVKRLHKNTIKVASKNGTFFEFTIYDLLFNHTFPMVKKLSILTQKISEILKLGGEIVISSGARDYLNLRAPRDIIALLCILDIDEDEARKCLSDNPMKILESLQFSKGGG